MKNENGSRRTLTRRHFLQGLTATGAMAMVPGSLLRPAATRADAFRVQDYVVRTSACQRNCYDTCSIKSYVKDGVLKFVEGNPQSTFTSSGLCVKGFSYPRRVYSPHRIKYPMEQVGGKGSGKWKRISWDEAIDRIAKKILEIKKQDGNLLGVALEKNSGSEGITNCSVIQGFFSAIGYTTRMEGSSCWPAGYDAQHFDFGNMVCNDPEDMANSKYVIVWGGNPAWTSVHSMKFIYAARERGAKFVVVDPVLSQTAAKADEYFGPKVGTDGALALGMARHILDHDLVDKAWVRRNAHGFEEFATYLRKNITLEWAEAETGIPAADIARLAEEFATADPATIWIGYGMQRHTNGGVAVRAIDALVAMTGNIGKKGGGARYGQEFTWNFNYWPKCELQPPAGSKGWVDPKAAKSGKPVTPSNRSLNRNQEARNMFKANPPIRMMWVSCSNPMSQAPDRNAMEKAYRQLEMTVVVDHFFTQTAELADIVLPTTTQFEEWQVDVSYWHYWLAINEQAIEPLYESKSNTEISAMLSKRMNELEPGSCTFPQDLTPKECMIRQFNDTIHEEFGISSWKDLLDGPVKSKRNPVAWADGRFETPSGKYEFKSEIATRYGNMALPEYKAPRKPHAPYKVLTPHTKFGLHSQFVNLDWMEDFNPEPCVYVNPAVAREKGIRDGDKARVFSRLGELTLTARLTDNVAPDTLLMYEAWFKNNSFNVQNVVDDTLADMGAYKFGGHPGLATQEHFADIEKA